MVGWLAAIGIGFINAYLAYAVWIIWPKLAAAWAQRQRSRILKL